MLKLKKGFNGGGHWGFFEVGQHLDRGIPKLILLTSRSGFLGLNLEEGFNGIARVGNGLTP